MVLCQDVIVLLIVLSEATIPASRIKTLCTYVLIHHLFEAENSLKFVLPTAPLIIPHTFVSQVIVQTQYHLHRTIHMPKTNIDIHHRRFASVE